MSHSDIADTDVVELVGKPTGRRRKRSVKAARVVESSDYIGALPKGVSYNCLFVDLNNLASFPTLAIGLLISSLRNRGHQVRLLSPLANNVPATERERQENIIDDIKRRVHHTDAPFLIKIRDLARFFYRKSRERPHPGILKGLIKDIQVKKPDVILLSAYLQHFKSIKRICKYAESQGIPVVLGGPMFNIPDVADSWRKLDGLTAIVGGEMDTKLPDIVEAVCSGNDMSVIDGVIATTSSATMEAAAPLRPLDATPIPDYTDFPWDLYPVRIIPIMTGRGCQWDKCVFCSDVISASGREFRTRSVENVLLEMQELSKRHNTTNFLFLDLKLNSWPEMIRGIAKDIQRYVPGAEWVGTVHIDLRKDSVLSKRDLKLAVESGMRRVSFGLESGSQRLLDLMNKGCSVERNSQFIKDAYDVGLSIRCTMFKGFPGETAEDMVKTAEFLEEHAYAIDRVRFNDFTLHTDTPIWREMVSKNGQTEHLVMKKHDKNYARTSYSHPGLSSPEYRKAKRRVLKAVYSINSRRLRESARQFDGLM